MTVFTNIKILIINLNRSPERRMQMEKKLKLLNVPYEFVDAVEGGKLDTEIVAEIHKNSTEYQKKFRRNLSPSEIGCALSHVKCYEKVVKEKIPFAIILEDDVYITDKNAFLAFYNHVEKFTLFELILLSFHTKTMPAYRKNIQQKNILRNADNIIIPDTSQQYIIGRPTSFHLGAGAYFISLTGCKKMLQAAHPIRMPADYLTGNAEKYGVSMGVLSQVMVHFEPSSLSAKGSTMVKRNISSRYALGRKLLKYVDDNHWIVKLLKTIHRYTIDLSRVYLAKYNIWAYKKFKA